MRCIQNGVRMYVSVSVCGDMFVCSESLHCRRHRRRSAVMLAAARLSGSDTLCTTNAYRQHIIAYATTNNVCMFIYGNISHPKRIIQIHLHVCTYTVAVHSIEWFTDTICLRWCGNHNHMKTNYCVSVCLFDENNFQPPDGIVVQLFLPPPPPRRPHSNPHIDDETKPSITNRLIFTRIHSTLKVSAPDGRAIKAHNRFVIHLRGSIGVRHVWV